MLSRLAVTITVAVVTVAAVAAITSASIATPLLPLPLLRRSNRYHMYIHLRATINYFSPNAYEVALHLMLPLLAWLKKK